MTMDLLAYNSYEDYLDAFINANDIRYLRNWALSRQFVQKACGRNCLGEVLMREEFEERRKLLADATAERSMRDDDLFSEHYAGRDQVLQQLAKREQLLLQKKISTIVFLLMRSKSGLEVSGFIDLEQSFQEARLKANNCSDWKGIFEGKAKLMPNKRHLSYWDWDKNLAVYNDSNNFSVVLEGPHSLLMMHRGDQKIICVNASCDCIYSRNTRRSMYRSRIYGYVIFFDHTIRRIN